jgi:hypothetical protein
MNALRCLTGLNLGLNLSASALRLPRGRKRARKFTAQVALLEERCLLSDAPMAPDTQTTLKGIFHAAPEIPIPTVTIYNNTGQTIYPVIYAPNSTLDQYQPGKALFDWYDTPTQDYRGYVGYEVKSGTKTTRYLGLLPNAKVTIGVPLVMWDSGRIAIATDPTLLQTPNVTFNYHTDAARFTTEASNYRVPARPGAIVQWYHWKGGMAQGISTAAPAQLLEVTERQAWMKNLPNWKDISRQANIPEAFTAVDYDVSYVDAMMWPAGMEAENPTVPFTGSPLKRLPFGWIGANTTTTAVQQQIQNFTSNKTVAGFPNGYLGQYFGGLGYDQYYFPPSLAGAGINIPAGNNLFQDAAINDTPSPFDGTFYKLTSGGNIYTQANVAKPGTTTQGQYTLSGLDPSTVAQLAPGMLIKDSSGLGSPILQSTRIASIVNSTTIQMTDPAKPGSGTVTRNYVFDGSKFTGTLKTNPSSNSMLIPSDPSFLARLLPGMLVSGPAGIPAGTRIKSITNTSVLLTGNVPPSTGASYTFSGGISDPYTTKLANLWYGWAEYYRSSHPSAPDIPFASQVSPLALSFSTASQPIAGQFAALVYDAMINFSKIPVLDNRLSGSTQLMQNLIGDNVGKIPGLSPQENARITNEVISLMDGVVNYQDPSSVPNWYSAPTDTTKYGGANIGNAPANFNVYNLNPYVWFVHRQLDLTGYAFSVDDGISNVNSDKADKLLVTLGPITSTNGQNLPNRLKYGNTTPWGPVTLKAKQVNSTTLKIADAADFFKLGQIGTGATVKSSAGDVNPGTTVSGVNDKERWILLKTSLKPSSSTNTYTFYDPGINEP